MQEEPDQLLARHGDGALAARGVGAHPQQHLVLAQRHQALVADGRAVRVAAPRCAAGRLRSARSCRSCCCAGWSSHRACPLRSGSQVVADFGPQGTLDQRLLERHRRGIYRLPAHRSGYGLINELLGDRRQRRRLGRDGRPGFRPRGRASHRRTHHRSVGRRQPLLAQNRVRAQDHRLVDHLAV